ncbi:MAG: transporter [bacterium]|nr:transporter [bacterium]
MKKVKVGSLFCVVIILFGFLSVGLLLSAQEIEEKSEGEKAAGDVLDLDLKSLLNTTLTAANPMGLHHTHTKGELMLAISTNFMRMEGNRDGTVNMSADEVLERYMVTPLDMKMSMIMLDFMYAFSDQVTVMVMLPYHIKSMGHRTRMGKEFRTRSKGPGDLQVSALVSIKRTSKQLIHINGGIILPTGSINRKDETPQGYTVLPYPMQIGSGTPGLRMGITYQGNSKDLTWGALIGGIVRIGQNKRGYRLGNELFSTLFTTYQFKKGFYLVGRFDGRKWGNIKGADSSLNPMMVPTADPNLRAGAQFRTGLSLNYLTTRGLLRNTRLVLGINLPIYQDLNGPQLKCKWILNIGIARVYN